MQIGYPLAETSVNPLEVTRYLLCFENGPDAASKAAFFVRFGFEVDRPDGLIEALRRDAAENPVREIWVDEWGLHAEVDGKLHTPDGRMPTIRTSWIRDHRSEGPARLVTAFPR